MKTKHTPTPWAWQIDHHKDDKGTPPYNVCSIIGNTGDDERRHSTVATTITDDEDAKFITLACNHHAELVATLQDVQVFARLSCPQGVDCDLWQSTFDRVESILTKLKG